MRPLVGLVLLLAVVGCSSEAKLGESCGAAGKTSGECEAGGICGKDSDGTLRCLKACASDADCPADRACNGVEGTSAKGCRLKK